jgi:hypothetical protein
MSHRIKHLQTFLTDKKKPEVIVPPEPEENTITKNTYNRQCRTLPITQLQSSLNPEQPPRPVITKTDPAKKFMRRCGRPLDALSRFQMDQALNIFTFDVAKQSRIYLWKCPEHGSRYLLYRYQPSDGVHVSCKLCNAKLHVDEVHFHGGESGDFQAISNNTFFGCRVCGVELMYGVDSIYRCSKCGLAFCITCGYIEVGICDNCAEKARTRSQARNKP